MRPVSGSRIKSGFRFKISNLAQVMVGGDKEDEGFTDEGVKVEMIGVEG